MVVTEDDDYVVKGPEPLQPIPDISLGELIYNNLRDVTKQNKIALVDAATSQFITYEEILKKSLRLAEALRRNGYGKDTIISISSENNLEFFIPIISALYIGAITVPINHSYTDSELTHCLNITKPKIIFCSRATASKYINLKRNVRSSSIEKIVVIDSDDDELSLNFFVYKSNIGINGDNVLGKLDLIIETDFNPAEQTAFILYSSGTTGLPKGVMLTHMNIMVRYMHTLDPRYVMKIEEDSAFLGILPFFHAYGLITNIFAIVQGQKIVVLKKFEEQIFLQAIQDYKISTLWLAPPLLVFFAKSPLVAKYNLSTVKEIASGAAPLSKETEEAVKKRLNIKSIRQGYGLTEGTLALICQNVGDERFGSSGKVVSYITCKVRDPETGRSLPANQVGELCFKGPMIMKGYYGNEKSTKDSFTSDGWLLTGDLGYYDAEGYFYIVDRLKELIKYKAFQVAPAELEAILLTHPKINDAAVVGLPREDVGELPVAFVVKNPNAQLTEKEVTHFVAGQVSSQKKLRGGVIFVAAIPKNPSGKILRRELRNILKKFKAKL